MPRSGGTAGGGQSQHHPGASDCASDAAAILSWPAKCGWLGQETSTTRKNALKIALVGHDFVATTAAGARARADTAVRSGEAGRSNAGRSEVAETGVTAAASAAAHTVLLEYGSWSGRPAAGTGDYAIAGRSDSPYHRHRIACRPPACCAKTRTEWSKAGSLFK